MGRSLTTRSFRRVFRPPHYEVVANFILAKVPEDGTAG